MTGWLLDTNVISEIVAPAPNPDVVQFIAGLTDPYLSVITIHELRYGIDRRPAGKRRTELDAFLDRTQSQFGARILDVTIPVAKSAAALRAARTAVGATLHLADALIAATALIGGHRIVTRNTKDFDGLGVTLSNPFSA